MEPKVKLYNPDCKLASVFINDEELYNRLRNHFLTYKVDAKDYGHLAGMCIISSTTVSSVAEDVEKLIGYTIVDSQKFAAWRRILQELAVYSKPGMIFLTLTGTI